MRRKDPTLKEENSTLKKKTTALKKIFHLSQERIEFIQWFTATMITQKTFHSKKTLFFKVRSTAVGGTKLIEVELSSSMLNSNDTFLLVQEKRNYLWIGRGSNQVEIDAAQFGASRFFF